jgi:hypothetical protein
MSPAEISLVDLIGAIVGFFLTVIVLFSDVFSDNPLFRVAISIFIGVASGYTVIVAWYNVILPQLIVPAAYGNQSERLFILFPLVLGGLLLFKASPRLSGVGNPAMAYLLGVGAAAAIGGAVLGTVLPQAYASMNLFDSRLYGPEESTLTNLAGGSVILLGTVTTLAYFHFSARQVQSQRAERPKWLEALAWVGQIFIAITLGALFAGVYTAALIALIERVQFIKDFIFALMGSQ